MLNFNAKLRTTRMDLLSLAFPARRMTMQTIQVQLAITLGDDAAKVLAELVAAALRQAAALTADDVDEGKEARLRASRNAIFAGQNPPEDQGLLIDSKQAARLLQVSQRTLWKMYQGGEMPPPIRIGRAVRWSLEALRKWVDEGCPPSRR
jgi:predicted DNA-binding transcriptional regulator AlpA